MSKIGAMGRWGRIVARLAVVGAVSLWGCDSDDGGTGTTDIVSQPDTSVPADAEADMAVFDIAATDTAADIGEEGDGQSSQDTAALDVEDTAADTGPDIPPPTCEGAVTALPLATTADETFRRGPYLQSVTKDSAIVVWRMDDAPAEGCVYFAVDGGDERESCGAPDERGQFELPLAGLDAAATVEYRVVAGESTTDAFAFRTAPAGSEPVRFMVTADTHANTATIEQSTGHALANGIDFAVFVGDLVSQPEENQWDAFFAGARALGHRVPIWPAIGNHEDRHPSYFQAFALPGAAPQSWGPESYYAFRWGNVWMGMLELSDISVTAVTTIDTPEVVWLREELTNGSAREAYWRLLFIHQPPHCQGWGHCDGYDGEPTLRGWLVPFAAEHGVTAIFSGHMHGWERGVDQGVNLIVTGGGGGGLDIYCPPGDDLPAEWTYDYVFHRTMVEADCDALRIEARDLDDELVDFIEIPHPSAATE